jgi:uncharacterized membrane protein YecN with MAPEG domain
MMPKIVPIYAAAIALMFVILAVRVTRLRRVKRIAIGSGGDARLERAIRVHANFSEYVPLTLLLLAFVEMQGNPAWLIHLLALALVAGRVIHAYGVSQEKEIIRIRTVGMVATFGVLIASSMVLLGTASRAVLG